MAAVTRSSRPSEAAQERSCQLGQNLGLSWSFMGEPDPKDRPVTVKDLSRAVLMLMLFIIGILMYLSGTGRI